MTNKIGNNKFIWSKNINENGYLNDEFGAYQNPNSTQFNSQSFDLEWEKVDNAKSYALSIVDFDATKVIGFPFIHWLVLNIKYNKLNVNDSFEAFKKWNKSNEYSNDILWQGFNSSIPETKYINNKDNESNLKGILPLGFTNNNLEESILYFGPYPPNGDHIYTVELFSLNVDANDLFYKENNTNHKLNKPFYYDQFMKSIDKHIIKKYILNFKYRKVE